MLHSEGTGITVRGSSVLSPSASGYQAEQEEGEGELGASAGPAGGEEDVLLDSVFNSFLGRLVPGAPSGASGVHASAAGAGPAQKGK